MFADGRAMPSPRAVSAAACCSTLGDAGYDFVAGLEVEFHLFRLHDPKLAPEDAGQPGTPPEVSLLTQGYQYLTEARLDEMEPILEVLQREVTTSACAALARGRVRAEPGGVHLCAGAGLEPADAMVLFRQRRSRWPSAMAITPPSCAGPACRT